MVADLPPTLVDAIELIRADRAHGASWLAREAARALAQAAATPGSDPEATLRAIHVAGRALATARPSMAILANVVAQVWQAGAQADPMDARARLTAVAEAARCALAGEAAATVERILAHARPLLRGIVYTHSRSGTVELALKRLFAESALRAVIVTESHPGDEGVALARELAANGVEVLLVSDAACRAFIHRVSAVVVGADSIRANGGIVNKVGTYPLALVAREVGVPVYVLAETAKIAPTHLPLVLEKMPGTELLPEPVAGITAFNPYFETVPPAVLTAIVTEEGILDRAALRERAERADMALAALLAGA